MVNIIKVAKYSIYIILIISVIWIILKKAEATKTQESGASPNNQTSGFDRVMVGVTGIMENVMPSHSLTRQIIKQKNTFINHL